LSGALKGEAKKSSIALRRLVKNFDQSFEASANGAQSGLLENRGRPNFILGYCYGGCGDAFVLMPFHDRG